MKCKKAIELLNNELTRAQNVKYVHESIFSEKGSEASLNKFCESLEIIQDCEEALQILNNKIRGQQV